MSNTDKTILDMTPQELKDFRNSQPCDEMGMDDFEGVDEDA